MSVEVVEADGLLSLAFGGTELVLDSRAGGVPKAAHWGSPLGATKTTLAQVLDAAALPPVPSSTDEPFALGLLPEATKGWQGIQGVEGARGDRGAGTRFEFLGWTIQRTNTSAAVNIRLADPVVGLSTEIELEATDGLLRLQPTLTNTSADPYRPAGVRLALPIPLEASEVLDLTGHPLSERRPQRRPLMQEAIVRENRRGRTGHDAATLLVAGVPGFGFERGEVWAVHLAWSGDAELFAQRMNNGCGILGGGELLHPGECTLDTGEALVSPWLYAVHGDGLDDLSHRLHTQILRIHDLTATTRPVTLNVWEAVYFDHRPDRVLELADAAATGRLTSLCGRKGCDHWPTMSTTSGCSSGSGSNRRWSAQTPTLLEPIRSGSSAQQGGHRC